MRYFVAFGSSLIVFLVIFSPVCRAHLGEVIFPRNITGSAARDKRFVEQDNIQGNSHHHHDRDSTRLPNHPPTTPDYSDFNTTLEVPSCEMMTVFPMYQEATVGRNFTLNCTCYLNSNHIHEGNCPEWKRVDNVLHLHSRRLTGNLCTATLELKNINPKAPNHFICVAGGEERVAHLHIKQSAYEESCQGDDDCIQPYSCKNSKCGCSDDKPLHIKSEFEDKCFSVRKPLKNCWNSVQCQAGNVNTHCLRQNGNGTSEDGVCLCNSGFEMEDGKCVCSDSMYHYVYSFSRRYRTVFYVLMATSSTLILLGIVRICVLYRRGPTRKLGCIVSTNSPDSQPIVTSEDEKPKL